MRLAEIGQKIKHSLGESRNVLDTLLFLGILCMAFSGMTTYEAFQAKESARRKALHVTMPPEMTQDVTEASRGAFVASTEGNIYYRTTCTGANRIQEAHRIWFGSASLAEKAGFTRAPNCP